MVSRGRSSSSCSRRPRGTSPVGAWGYAMCWSSSTPTRDSITSGTYFDLKESLEQILGRPVDVVSATSIRNPYFRDQVMRTREKLYAA